MAVGSTEIATGFDMDPKQHAYGPKIPSPGVCGKCGAVVAGGFEVTHAAWHNTGAWSQQAMTVRAARTGWEANAP